MTWRTAAPRRFGHSSIEAGGVPITAAIRRILHKLADTIPRSVDDCSRRQQRLSKRRRSDVSRLRAMKIQRIDYRRIFAISTSLILFAKLAFIFVVGLLG